MSTDNWRFSLDLSSYPKDESLNSWVPEEFSSVKYASFDSVIDKLTLGPGALIAKVDCKSAFRTIPMSVGTFNLLAFSLDKDYHVNVCLTMEAATSCATYETFSHFFGMVCQA